MVVISMVDKERPGLFRWNAGVLLCIALLCAGTLAGCHGDTDQGGGPDRGRAGSSSQQRRAPQPQSVPTPPSADQVDPSSPQAVIHGTSTTQPGAESKPTPLPPPRQAPQ